MPKDTLSVTDNRTGKTFEIPIADGCVKAMDLRQMKTGPDDFGLMTYDPAFLNTANCRSSITYIDGDKGILEYRGYPIEQLAEKSTHMEVSYLLMNGELPNAEQLGDFTRNIARHTYVHENVRDLMKGFRYDAHPMSVLASTVAALAGFYPEARNIKNKDIRRLQMMRAIAKMPTLAAFAYRHSVGRPCVYPDADLSYTENFLNMMVSFGKRDWRPDPTLVKALDLLFILHADHEQNCSTTATRVVGSSEVDPYSAVASGVTALFGPLHGGANEAVLRMLREIGDKKNVPAFIQKVKGGDGTKLMGFGHRVYKNYDPRAKVIKKACDQVFAVTGRNPLLDTAVELERIALQDPYFIERKLYPNVDFYSGVIYEAMGFPTEFYTLLFAIPRTVGWVTQWEEMLLDPDQKIARPRQIYTGKRSRDYVEMGKR
jgi:citrate synthase